MLKMFEQAVSSSKACEGESAIISLKLRALFHVANVHNGAQWCSEIQFNAMQHHQIEYNTMHCKAMK